MNIMANPHQEIEDLEIRSEDVQEILGTPPPWMLRFGNLLALVMLVVLGWLSYWIKYPDVVEGDIRISFKNPPYRLVAQQGNYIQEVLVRNNQKVVRNQALIVFRNNADFRQVLALEDRILSLNKFDDSTLMAFDLDRTMAIGDLQEDLFAFLDSKVQLQQSRVGSSGTDIGSLQRQIGNLERVISLQRRASESLSEQIREAEQDLANAEYRMKFNQASAEDVNRFRSALKRLKDEQLDREATLKGSQSEISNLRGRINTAQSGAVRSANEAASELKESFFRLRARLETWKKNYLILSPGEGVVQIVGNNVAPELFVKEGDELIAVVPSSDQQLVGRMNLPFVGSGKVRAHQKVIVKLESLPFQEYGTVQGEVFWKSKVTRNEGERLVVPVEISFARGVTTSTGKTVDANEELVGKARIITEEKRFIERVFFKLRNLNPNYAQ